MLLLQSFQILVYVLIPCFHVIVLLVSDSAACLYSTYFHFAVSRVLDCGVHLGPLFSCYCFSGFRLQNLLIPCFHVTASVVSDCCVSWLSVFMLLFQWFQILQSVLIPYFHVTVSMVSDSAECFDPLFSCYCFNGFRFCRVFWSPVFMLLFQWF